MVTRKFKTKSGEKWTITELPGFSNPNQMTVEDVLDQMAKAELKFIFPDKKIK